MVWLLSFTRFASLTKRIALIVAVEARLRVISPPVMTAATVANGRIGFGIIFVCANFFRGNFSNSWSAWSWLYRKPNILSHPFGPGKRPTSSVGFDGYNSLESETNNLSKKKAKQFDFDTADVADCQLKKVIAMRPFIGRSESLPTHNSLLQQEQWSLWYVNNKNNNISVGVLMWK